MAHLDHGSLWQPKINWNLSTGGTLCLSRFVCVSLLDRDALEWFQALDAEPS